MHTVPAIRNLIVAALAASLAACTTADHIENTDLGPPAAASETGSDTGATDTPVRVAEGTEARFCPQASIREGTSTLSKKEGDALDYQAVLVNAKRDCRIVDGKLKITVGVEGRLMPGRAAKSRTVELPVRVAVVGQDGVVYSNLGKIKVAVEKGATSRSFRYVDEKIVIPPASGGMIVYTGFDEGPPKQG
ncbi:hypothetical protein E3C22_20690 [Jiella endophytica]|uniref:Lipoprotein n=1 Tax=Jiella endophytica TaxID=2558362 RepID=A0A4Y8RDE0_9HYPH|nr:hypothetical protein [Jiella endophytica]TFF19184.1 hypothetical protein E3C22_20690 [Jiella endophytica]